MEHAWYGTQNESMMSYVIKCLMELRIIYLSRTKIHREQYNIIFNWTYVTKIILIWVDVNDMRIHILKYNNYFNINTEYQLLIWHHSSYRHIYNRVTMYTIDIISLCKQVYLLIWRACEQLFSWSIHQIILCKNSIFSISCNVNIAVDGKSAKPTIKTDALNKCHFVKYCKVITCLVMYM